MNGLAKLLGSRKGLISLISMAAQIFIGQRMGIDPAVLMGTLSATAGAHAIGQGIADVNTGGSK